MEPVTPAVIFTLGLSEYTNTPTAELLQAQSPLVQQIFKLPKKTGYRKSKLDP